MIRSVGFRLSQGLPPLTRPVLASMAAERVKELYVGNRQQAELLRKQLQETEDLGRMLSSDLGNRTTALTVIPYSGKYANLSNEALESLYKFAQMDKELDSSTYNTVASVAESSQKLREQFKEKLERTEKVLFELEQEIAKRDEVSAKDSKKTVKDVSKEDSLSDLSDAQLKENLKKVNSKIEKLKRLENDKGIASGEKSACKERIETCEKERERLIHELNRRKVKFDAKETQNSEKPIPISRIAAVMFVAMAVFSAGIYTIYKVVQTLLPYAEPLRQIAMHPLRRIPDSLSLKGKMDDDVVFPEKTSTVLRLEKAKDEMNEVLEIAINNATLGFPYSEELKKVREIDMRLSVHEYLDRRSSIV